MAVKEKIRIRLKGYDHQAGRPVGGEDRARRQSARALGFPVRSRCRPRKQIITILRAVHKYKDSREQFEMSTHKRLIDILQTFQQDR